MMWVLIWAVLVLGALAVLFLLGRRLWRQTKALSRELSIVSDQFAEVSERLAELDATRQGGPYR
jgi:hypothetical protein